MATEKNPNLDALLIEILQKPQSERASFLNLLCRDDDALRVELQGLLAAHAEAGDFLDQPAVETPSGAVATLARPASEQPGTVIDRYKLLQQIGEGGFGVVYMAEQEKPVRRKVALKIIKLGMDTKQVIARFEAERQALAMMDHPNIAKVLDAGATDTGRPYFVMELVKGESITEYCDKNNIDVEQRLALFQQVCHAVQHAHQKGIIHRDLKPSNVMITMHDGKPVPKVIDFGIAKATNQRLTEKTVFTEFKQFIGTPEYMSPEQAEMSGIDIDTRSDIYSLGVLLYELLTGTTPFDSEQLRSAAYGEIQRIIREETPHKPSTKLSTLDTLPSVAAQRQLEPKKLGILIRGDLDWIVMKALEKDRTRRYETANGFAADIQRHMDSEPVEAGPPSASYKLRKFVKRNKAGVAAASVVAAVLVLGVAGTTWGMVRALRAERVATDAAEAERDARQEAQESAEAAQIANENATRRAEELEQVAEFQAEQLSDIDVALMGLRLRTDLLAKVRVAAERSGLEPAQIDERIAEVERLIAGADFTGMALQTLDENVFARAINVIETQFADQPLVKARLLQTVASTVRDLGLYDLAASPQADALSTRREQLGDDDPQTLTSIFEQAMLLRFQGSYREALPLCQEVYDGRSRVLGEEHSDTLEALYYLGNIHSDLGDHEKAVELAGRALEGLRRVLGNDHRVTLEAVNDVGAALFYLGRLEEAEPNFQEALDGNRRILGDEHPITLTLIANMGIIRMNQRNYEEAEAYQIEAMEGRRRVLGDDHPSTIGSIHNLGTLRMRQRRYAEAEVFYRETLDRRRRVLGNDHPLTLFALKTLGNVLRRQRKLAEAESSYREALQGERRILGDDHPNTISTISMLGLLMRMQRKNDEAETFYIEALERRRRLLGDDHLATINSINDLGFLFFFQGMPVEAMPYLQEVLERRRRVLGDDHMQTLNAILTMGDVLRRQGKLVEAEPYYRESLQGNRRVLGDDHPDTIREIPMLGSLMMMQGRNAEAELLYVEALERRRRVLGDDNKETIKSITDMASLRQAQGNPAEAVPYLREALQAYRRVLGDEHRTTLSTMMKLGHALIDLSSFQEAEEYYRECYETRRRELEENHWQIFSAMSRLGVSITGQGRYAEAEPMLIEGYEKMQPPAQSASYKAQALQHIIELYDAWHEAEPEGGHDAKAAQWRAKLDANDESAGDADS